MNVLLDRKLQLSAARAPGARVEEATVIAMGQALSAIFFDRPDGRRERLQAEQDSQPIPRPFITAELALRSGGTRHVLFLPQPAQAVLARPLLLRLNAQPVAEIDPAWLQLPQEDLPALTAQLSPAAMHRLLRVLLTTGASLFDAKAQAGLAEAIPQLMDMCDMPALIPVASAQIGGRMLLSYATTTPVALPDHANAVALSQGRLIRLKECNCFWDGKQLHVLLPQGLDPASILAFPDLPLRLAPADPATPRLSMAAWLQGRDTSCGAWLFARVGNASRAALEREFAEGSTEPTITVRHLSATSTGVLHALVLEDPARLVRRVILERQGQQVDLDIRAGADGSLRLTGLAALPGNAQGGDLCQIRVQHHSGRLRQLGQVTLAAYDGGLPVAFQEAWGQGAEALQPLARARAEFRRLPPPCVTQQFGAARQSALRIVTAIGGSADMIRARAAMIMAERQAAPVEVICAMADGPLAPGARQALAEAAEIYGIAHRLVLLPGFAHAGEHLRAALMQAQDAPALVLGADVLPQDPGWLAFWLRRLRRQDALAGALLATDGAIAAVQEGRDPCRGLPAAHLPAPGRPAPRPLADCVALAPTAITRLLGTERTHPDPALWIAGALAGTARTETRFAFRRFAPATTPGNFATALAETAFALIGEERE